MPESISTGMTVRDTQHGLGVIRFVRDGHAITEFPDGVYPLPVSRLQTNPQPNVTGELVRKALGIYKALFLRQEKGEELSTLEKEAFQGAIKLLEVKAPDLDPHAEHLRGVRAAQPRVSSDVAHERACRALATAQTTEATE